MTTAAAFPPRLPSTCIVCCRIIRNKSLNMLRLERKHIFARQIFMFKITRASQSHKNLWVLYTFLLPRACWMCRKKNKSVPVHEAGAAKKVIKLLNCTIRFWRMRTTLLAQISHLCSPDDTEASEKLAWFSISGRVEASHKSIANYFSSAVPDNLSNVELINWSSFKRQPACHLRWNSIGIN